MSNMALVEFVPTDTTTDRDITDGIAILSVEGGWDSTARKIVRVANAIRKTSREWMLENSAVSRVSAKGVDTGLGNYSGAIRLALAAEAYVIMDGLADEYQVQTWVKGTRVSNKVLVDLVTTGLTPAQCKASFEAAYKAGVAKQAETAEAKAYAASLPSAVFTKTEAAITELRERVARGFNLSDADKAEATRQAELLLALAK